MLAWLFKRGEGVLIMIQKIKNLIEDIIFEVLFLSFILPALLGAVWMSIRIFKEIKFLVSH